jgi:hypothetical protein
VLPKLGYLTCDKSGFLFQSKVGQEGFCLSQCSLPANASSLSCDQSEYVPNWRWLVAWKLIEARLFTALIQIRLTTRIYWWTRGVQIVIPAAVLCSSKTDGRQSHGNRVQWMMHLLVNNLEAEVDLLLIIKVLCDLPL